MTPEDRLKLEALAETLGLPKSQVLTQGVRLLWNLHEAGLLREVVRTPIRTSGGRTVFVEFER